MAGWIALHRSAFEHPLLADDARFRAWFWLVANAAWASTSVRIKGEMVQLERGELSFSQRFLAQNWGWSKSRVDRFIADLRREGMIATRSKIGAGEGHNAGQGQAIISICNYDRYQDVTNRSRGNDVPESGAIAGQQRGKEEQGNHKTTSPVERARARGDTGNYKSDRSRTLPADWSPDLHDAEMQTIIAGWPSDHFDHELSKFRNHAVDKGRRSNNWQAAFRTWLLKALDRDSGNGLCNTKRRYSLLDACREPGPVIPPFGGDK